MIQLFGTGNKVGNRVGLAGLTKNCTNEELLSINESLFHKLSKSKLAICSQEVNSIFRGLQTGSVNVAHAPYLPVGSNSTIGH